jgi:hypothetical protein
MEVAVKFNRWFSLCVMVLLACGATACASDISGTIGTTLTVTDNSRLVGNVTCTVTGAPCIVIGAPGITLDLSGYTITGLGDPETGCSGAATASEVGILVNNVNNVSIQGLGVLQQFRNFGIQLLTAMGATVTNVTSSTNCTSGIIVSGGSNNLLENNTSARNGTVGAPCGGI